MSPEHKGATDKLHTIKLESEILVARWAVAQVAAGAAAPFEIFTRFVGHGAEAGLEFKAGNKKVGALETRVFSDQCHGAFEVPGDAKGDLTFEVQLKQHKLKLKSEPIPVHPAGRYENLRWDRKEARRGDTVKMTAEVEDVRDGTRVLMQIYEHDDDGGHDLITAVEGEVKEGALEALWDYEYFEDTDSIPTAEEAEQGYSPPEYFFRIDEGEPLDSGLLGFRDYVEISLTMGGTRPAADEEYVLTLPDGSEREGKLDSDGKATEHKVPPGNFTVRFPRLQGAPPA
ncbi:MAG: hypothetical protein ABIS67_08900 [Candidatus Eisenbacteria bacterium]